MQYFAYHVITVAYESIYARKGVLVIIKRLGRGLFEGAELRTVTVLKKRAEVMRENISTWICNIIFDLRKI
jgi:hypothetical protein